MPCVLVNLASGTRVLIGYMTGYDQGFVILGKDSHGRGDGGKVWCTLLLRNSLYGQDARATRSGPLSDMKSGGQECPLHMCVGSLAQHVAGHSCPKAIIVFWKLISRPIGK